jgi:hypothetical protein
MTPQSGKTDASYGPLDGVTRLDHPFQSSDPVAMPKVAIVQFDDRPDNVLWPLNALMARNAQYAKAHGYHYEFSRQTETDIPPHWNKIFLVERFLGAGYDIVAWLDSDAVVHDFSIAIESLFEKDTGFVFSSDLPIWRAESPINAGVFFARGEFGRTLMREWGALFPAPLWRKKDNTWNFAEHAWAGPAYEQGAFSEKLLPRYKGPALRQLPWQILQSPYPQPGAFTLHFPNHLRANSLLYLHQIDAKGDLAKPPT